MKKINAHIETIGNLLSIEQEILPENMLKIARLYYLQRLTQRQIAKQLNLPIGQVRQLLSKGTYLLRKHATPDVYEQAFLILYDKDKA